MCMSRQGFGYFPEMPTETFGAVSSVDSSDGPLSREWVMGYGFGASTLASSGVQADHTNGD